MVAVPLPARGDIRLAPGDYGPEEQGWNGLSHLFETAAEAQVDLAAAATLDWNDVRRSTVLLILSPLAPLDMDNLTAFLRDGGRAVLADDYGTGDALLRRLGLRRGPAPAGHRTFLAGRDAFPVFDPKREKPHFLFFNTTQIAGNHAAALWVDEEAAPLTTPILRYEGEGGGTFALERVVGRGRILVIADASVFINEMTRALHGNKQFVANVMRMYCGAKACAVTLVLPDSAWSGRYRPGPPEVDDLETFFRASVAVLDGLVRDLDRWLGTPPLVAVLIVQKFCSFGR